MRENKVIKAKAESVRFKGVIYLFVIRDSINVAYTLAEKLKMSSPYEFLYSLCCRMEFDISSFLEYSKFGSKDYTSIESRITAVANQYRRRADQ